MLRLDYLYMRGDMNESGDKLEWEGGAWFVKSFANRDNNGTQLVPDDFPVVIFGNNGVERSKLAIDVEWKLTESRSSNGAYYAIKSWKPDYDKLLEQQSEYDKQQEKPIEEIMINAKESKMSEFEYGQKIYIKNHDKREFKFACYHIDGDSILFMFDDGYGHVGIDNVSATPFKTELEIAKEKQLENLSIKYNYVKGGLFWGKVKSMQESGELAEITLPLGD